MNRNMQAALGELTERISKADAIVIGGGSGLSSTAGYDGLLRWQKHWLHSGIIMDLLLRWLDSTTVFPTMGSSGVTTVSTFVLCGMHLRDSRTWICKKSQPENQPLC